MIVIIDYGAGNTANVKNAFEKLGTRTTVSDDTAEWKKADALVFPGVGSFGAAMGFLGEKSETIKQLSQRLPFLGICLGMQLLMDDSRESPGVSGFGLVEGRVKKFSGLLPVPQIGWNRIEQLESPLFEGLRPFYAYFANSYYCEPEDKSLVAATTTYGAKFASAFSKKNIFATQFHPEKSGEKGLQVLENFIKEVRR
jgi:glutamine amidotransferase